MLHFFFAADERQPMMVILRVTLRNPASPEEDQVVLVDTGVQEMSMGAARPMLGLFNEKVDNSYCLKSK